MEIKVIPTAAPKAKPDESSLGFGKIFTDHMFIMDWDSENGWQNARIEPFGNLSLHPAATVFHYGAEIFEGLKAYRRPDGQVQLFRPEENIKRMNQSAETNHIRPKATNETGSRVASGAPAREAATRASTAASDSVS